MVRIDNPPAYFNLDVNLMKPGTGASEALIYRQCFAPTTVLLFVVKDATTLPLAATFCGSSRASTRPSRADTLNSRCNPEGVGQLRAVFVENAAGGALHLFDEPCR